MNKKDEAKYMIGKKIINSYYEKDGDYFVIEFDNDTEISFRFMRDIVKARNGGKE